MYDDNFDKIYNQSEDIVDGLFTAEKIALNKKITAEKMAIEKKKEILYQIDMLEHDVMKLIAEQEKKCNECPYKKGDLK